MNRDPMRRFAHIIIVLACVASSRCGDPSQPPFTPPTPVVPPTAPAPQPTQTFSLSGLVKEAWIDTGLSGATVTIATGPSRGSTTTDEQGRYALTNLVPGVYSVTFSKGAPWGSRTFSPVNVFADATFSGAVSLTGGFPLTASSLQGYWVAQGPYPNEPSWILIIQKGTRLEGWYKDRRDYSTAMSGTYADGLVSHQVVGTSGLTIEGRVRGCPLHSRCHQERGPRWKLSGDDVSRQRLRELAHGSHACRGSAEQ